MIKLASNIACLYEGSAEKAILEILSNNDLLIFNKENLIEGDFIRRISGKEFARRYLGKTYSSKVSVIRIIDKKNENFVVPRPYKDKIEIHTIITKPEIEMLVIHKEGKFADFKKSKLKPSAYCKIVLGFSNVKNYTFVKEYFNNKEDLMLAIKEYVRCKQKDQFLNLLDIIKH